MSTTPPNLPPADSNNAERGPAPEKRSLLIEQLEERILFDAVPVGPVDLQPESGFDASAFVQIANQVEQPVADGASDGEQQSAREVLFVDKGVEGYQDIVAGFVQGRDIDVFLINPGSSGLEQIANHLDGRTDLTAIHIVSHGDDARLRLGNSNIGTAELSANYSAALARIGNALSDSGDLLIYGCQLAESAEGEAFVRSLSELTGADVAASDDLTGHESLGGDWNLEYSTGKIEASVQMSKQAQLAWRHVLVEFVPGALVGVDISPASDGNQPVNFNHATGAGTFSNLIDENGATTGISLQISSPSALFGFTGTFGDADPSTIPTFTNDLSGLDEGFYDTNTDQINLVFRGLNAGEEYALYTFGNIFVNNLQNIEYVGGNGTTNAGGSIIAAYDLAINGIVGSTTAALEEYAVIMTADASGEIRINITSNYTAFITGAAISTAAGVAPEATPDVAFVIEDTAPNPVTGNVLANDTTTNGPLTVNSVNGAAGNVGAVLTANYGTMQINADGSYTYTLDDSDPAVQALNDQDNIVYIGTDSNTIEALNLNTGAQSVVTTSALAAIVNGLSGNADNNVAYYGDDTNIYVFDPVAGTHAVLTSLAAVGIPVTEGLASGGAAYINGSIYIGTEAPGGGDAINFYRIDLAANGLSALPGNATVIDIIGAAAAAGAPAIGGFGDMIVSDGVLFGSTSGAGFWSYDLTTLEFVHINSEYRGQLASTEDGRVFSVNGSDVQQIDLATGKLTGSIINATFTAADASSPISAPQNPSSVLTETFTYTIVDADGDETTTTITVTIGGSNDAPIATDHSITVLQDSTDNSAGATTLPTDTDNVDSELTVTINSVPAAGQGEFTIGAGGAAVGAGTVLTPAQLAALVFTPASSYSGPVADLAYTVTDPRGLSDTAVISVTINGAPTATNNSGTVVEDTQLTETGNVVTDDDGDGQDSDPESESLTVVEVNGSTSSVGIDLNGIYGTVRVNSDGSYTYTLDNNNSTVNGLDTGESLTETFTYAIQDPNDQQSSATLTITIEGSNDAPVYSGTPISDQVHEDDETISSVDVTGAFSDPEGDTLTYTVSNLPAGLSISSSGMITGTIDNSASQGGTSGVYSITVTATDDQLETTSTTFTWTVTNPGPTAFADANTTLQSTTASGNVIGNDNDPDGDTITVLAVNGQNGDVGATVNGDQGGDFTINSDGSYSFDPAGDFDYLAFGETESTVVSYTITDSEGGTSTATLTVVITGENDAPQNNGSIPPQDDVDSEDITLDVSGYFTDADTSNSLSFSATGLPNGLSIDADGLITGTLTSSASQSGPFSVTVTVSDGTVISQQTFAWTVTNPAPDAFNDFGATDQDSPTSGDVVDNDSDPDGDTITVTEVGNHLGSGPGAVGNAIAGAGGGLFTLFTDGGYDFDPNGEFDSLSAGESATTWVTYEITDADGATHSATLEVTVTGTNEDPTVVAIPDQVNEDIDPISGLDVSGYFLDGDANDTLLFSASGLPAGLVMDTAGVISGTIAGDASVGGPYTVTVTADDQNSGTVQQTFEWTVTNPLPVAEIDYDTSAQTGTAAGNVLTNDADPDFDTINVLSVNGNQAYVGVEIDGSAGGRFTINADGSYDFSTDGDFNYLADGETVVTYVTYNMTDNQGGQSGAELRITITGSNDDPVVDSAIPDQDNLDSETVSLPVSSFFSDPDTSDSLEFSATGLPPGLVMDPDGNITGTIDSSASQAGNYSVTVTADDGNGGTTTALFNWTVTNVRPNAADDFNATDEETAVGGDVIANDSDPDGDTITVTGVGGVTSTSPANVGVPYTGSNGGVFVVNPNGSYSFDPDGDFEGLADGEIDQTFITYTITDADGGTRSASLVITITGTNDGPTATNNTGSVTDGTQPSDSGNLISDNDGAGVDSDPDGDTLTVKEFAGSAANVDAPFTTTYGTIQVNTDGSYTYTVDANNTDVEELDSGEFLTETFSYTVTDSEGGDSSAVLTVTINGTNDAPIVSGAIPPQANEDSQTIATVDVTSAFSDIDGDNLQFSATGLPAGLSIDANGLITGTIDHSESVTGTFAVTVTASDGDESVSTVFTWTVTNPGPDAVDDTGATTENALTAGTVFTNDSDPDGDTIVVNAVNTAGSDVGQTVAGSDGGTFIVNSDGSYDFDPSGDFDDLAENETTTTSVTYTITDNEGGTDTATLTLTITGTNDDPVANGQIPDQTSVDDETIATLNVSSFFDDADTSDTLTFTATGLPDGLSIDAAGNITGTIDNSESVTGTFSVTVIADDGNGGTVEQIFEWAVANPGPVAGNDTDSTTENASVSGSLFGNDSDPDGDTINVVSVEGDTNFDGNAIDGSDGGKFTINANGSYSFDPDADFEYLGENETATTSVSYRISDGEGGFATATLEITVTGTNDDPTSNGQIPDQTSVDAETIATLNVSSFFDDADTSDTLTFTATGLPAGLVMDTAGNITGTIDNSASVTGSFSVTVTADDGHGGTVARTFIWSVANPGPTATGNTAEVTEGSSLTDSGNLVTDDDGFGSDSDPDADTLTVLETGSTTLIYGTIVVNADGGYTYTLDNNNATVDGLDEGETLTDTFAYTVTDSEGGQSIANLTITINGENDAPVAGGTIPPQAGFDSDTVATVDASLAFSDPDGDTLTYSAGNLPDGLSIDENTGLITGTPGSSASTGAAGGVYTVTVTATDDNNAAVSTTFDWTVTNPAPTAGDDTFTTDEDTAISGIVTANDADPDGDDLTFALDTSAANGNVSLGSDGSFTYTPDPDFHGTDSFTYTLTDADGAEVTATVDITVDPVNDSPAVDNPLDDQASVDSETISLDISGSFSDVDGDDPAFSATGLPPGLTIDTNGNITGTITSSASVGGTYSVEVTVDDGNGGVTIETFDWTVTNPAPVAGDDSYTTSEDTMVSGTVVTNDSDVDGDAMTYMVTGGPSNGQVTLNSDGTFDYTPDPDFTGTDSFDYELTDADGATTTATVTITVDPVNDAPVADSPFPDQSNLDSDDISISIAGNFNDVEGDSLEFSATGLPPGLVMDPDGNITGTIDSSASQAGNYSVTVTADDGNGGTTTALFNWTVTNVRPNAADDFNATDEETAVGGDVIANDSDPDGDTITVTGVGGVTSTSPANVGVPYTGSNGGVFVVNPNGSYSFDPDGDFEGLADGEIDQTFITYTITDADGGTRSASLVITITGTNDGPTATNNTGSVTDGTQPSDSGNLISDNDGAGVDSDPDGDTLTVKEFAGSAANVDAPFTTTYGTIQVNTDGSYTYTVDANNTDVEELDSGEFLTETFSYTVTDSEGGDSSAVLTVTINGTNDAPIVSGAIPPQANEDSQTIATVDVTSAFSDIDGDNLQFSATGLPAGLSIDANGLITGTIDHSESVTGTFAVTVTASDGDESVSTVFTWTVTNPGPDAVDDTGATTENALTAGTVFTNDSDPDGDTIVVNAVNTAGSDVGQTVAGSDGGTFIVNSDGSYDFDPSGDFDDLAENETTTTSVTYTITDNEGGTDTATLTLTITGTNDDPVANGQIPDQTSVDDETIATLNVSSFFDDADTSDTLTFTATGLPDGLSIDAAGNITGTIDNSESVTGTFSVTVIADDGNGGTVEQIFEWAVANPGPVAGNDTDSTTENASVSGSLFGNDSDPDGDTINVVSVEGDTNFDGNAIDGSDGGKFTINANGSYSFDPDADFEYLGENETATTSVSYRISDGEGGFATATLEITVTGTNDDPTSNGQIPDQTSVDAETIATLNVSSFFDDADTSDTLTFTATGLPAGLVMDTAGNITGTIDHSESVTGTFAVTVTASDGDESVSTVFTWTVTNPGPDAVDDTGATTENALTAGTVFTNDSDPDGDTIVVNAVNTAGSDVGQTVAGSDGGTFIVNSDGSYDFDPSGDFDDLAENETTTTSVTYTITDNEGGTDTATLTLTITGTNDDPVANGQIPDQTSVDDETIATLNVSSFFDDADTSDTLTFTATGLPDGLSIDAAGNITGTIDNSESVTGTFSVTVIADDGNGGTVEQIFEWAVANPGPVAGNDTDSTTENASVSGSLFGNDSDPDGDTINVVSVEGDTNFDGNAIDGSDGGKFTINANGSYSFDPDADFEYLGENETATTSVSYRISDGEGGFATATLEITVTGTNDDPTSNGQIPDQTSVDAETIATLNVSSFFDDADTSDTLTFTATGLPAGLVMDTAGNITGTIDHSESVTGTFAVTVTASDGDESVSTVFTWTVTNPGPDAVDDTGATTENALTAGTVFTNDSDPDGDTIVVNAVNTAGSDVGQTVAGSDGGTFIVNSDGSYDFDPSGDFDDLAENETTTTSVTYTITDNEGGTDTATLTLTITGTNDDPVANGQIPDQTSVDDETIATLNVSSFFDDADTSDTLTFTATGLPDGLSIDAAGNITGTIDNSESVTGTFSVTVIADDGNGGTVEQIFEWAVANPGPVAGNDTDSTTENASVSGSLFGNDSDPDGDTINVVSVEGDTNFDGNAIDGSDGGKFTINANGSYSFDPDADFEYLGENETATTSVSYRISDGEGGFATATLEITVTGTNDDPTSNGQIPDQTSVDAETIATLNVSSFFDDADTSDTLTFTATGLPAGLVMDTAGNITGTIDNSASVTGSFSVTVTADDGHGGTVARTFIWSVANPGPTATGNTAEVTEGSSLTDSGNLVTDDDGFGSDSDPDADTLTVLETGSTTLIYGTIVVNADGGYTYTLDNNNATVDGLDEGETLTDTFAYTVTDSEGGQSIANLTITINGENDAPVAGGTIPPQAGFDSDTVATVDASLAFSDPDGDTLTYSAGNLPDGLSIDENTGLITGTPGSSASTGAAGGVYTVTVTATDDNNAAVSTTFDWTVTNPAPTAGDDTFTTDEDTAISGIVTANDADPDGDDLTFALDTSAANGNVSLGSDGSFTYTPDPDFHGTDSFTYTLTDADGAEVTATVDITVDPVNDSPAVDNPLDDQASVDSETISLDISGSFSDVDGDDPAFSATGLPPGLTIDTNGNITGTITSSASVGGTYSVEVTVDDGNGGVTIETFDWTVTNPAPVAGDDSYTTSEDTMVSGTVVTNDSDVDGDAMTYMVTGGPSNGQVTLNSDGTFDYTPDPDFTGTDSFDYELTDADGATTTATVTITVDPVNDAPVADSPFPDQSNLDSDDISISIAGNFNDVEGDSLEFSATGLPPGLVMDPDGNITGTIDSSASQAGNYSVTVTADDGNGGTTTALFNWTVTNPAPVAGDDNFNTDEDTAISGIVTANDSDPDGDSVTFEQLTFPLFGDVVFNGDGSFTYTPDDDFNGTDSFDYDIVDADGTRTTATVTINVAPVNDTPNVDSNIPNQSSQDSDGIILDIAPNFSDVEGDTLTFSATGLPPGLSMDTTGSITGTIDSSASAGGTYTVTVTADDGNDQVNTTFEWTVTNPAPDAVNDSFNTDEDTAVSGDASANDSDPDGDTITFTKLTDPANGSVNFLSDGTFTYTPDTNFSGIDSFGYEVIDADGSSTTATITIIVGDVNDPPAVTTPIPDQSSLDSELVSVDVSGNFGDVENDTLTFSATGLPPGLGIDPDTGVIFGTIDSSASAGGPYSVTVFANDGNATGSDTFEWTVDNVAPVAGDDNFTTDEDTAVSGTVTGNDSDPDNDILTFSDLTTPANGSVTLDPDGTFTYTPDLDFEGTDSFDYTVADADGATRTATVTIVVTPVNDAPVTGTALPEQFSLDSETGISVDIGGGFQDVDGDDLTYTADGLPAGLTLDPVTGLITGTINSSESSGGPYTVEIVATDPDGESATQQFTWNVDNPTPTAGDDSFTTNEDTVVSGDVTGNDTDPDGDPVDYAVTAEPMNGSVSMNPNGTFSYTPDPNFNGTESFEYTLTDADGATTTAVVTINVTPVNDPPVVTDSVADQSSIDSTDIVLDVSDAFDDIDSPALTYTATGLPAGLSIDPVTGIITGTIDPGASSGGPYPVVLTAQDPDGQTVTDTFTWNVDNLPPVAEDDTFTTDEDTPLSGSVAGNDSDPDGDAVSFSLLPGGPSHGILSFNPDGSFDYIPDADYTGPDQFDYTICDADGFCTTAVATINVTPVNDPPVVNNPVNDRSEFDSDDITLDVSTAFDDAEGDNLTFTATGLPPGLSIDNNTGIISGTIDPGASSGGPYTVEVVATDPSGESATDTFSWTVENIPPVAEDDSFATSEDTSVSGSVTGNDSDPDGDTATFTTLSGPANGTLDWNTDGTFTYTPDPDFNGTDSFVYEVADADGATATAVVTIDVAPVNDGPSATDGADTTDQDTPIDIDLTVNDFDPEGDTLTIVEINGQSVTHGEAITLPSGAVLTINGDGTIDYDPANAFDSLAVGESAIDRFEYTVDDGNGGTATAETVVTINGENDPPVASDDYVKITVDTPVTINVLTNDVDPEGEPLDVILLNNPNGGTATVNPNGTIAFVPDDGFEGTVDIHYLIEDPHGATSEATLTIEVEPEFRFDSFTNFADSFDTSHLNSGVNHQAAPGREILSQKIFTLAPEPIFSGHARPGTQIVGRIYDESGTLIGEASANTDPGGNWMMQFQGTEGNNFYRIEFEQVSAGAADVYGYFGLNPADNTYQAMESITTYEDPLSVEKAMQSSLDSIQQIHRVNENPLGFGLDKEN